MTDVSPETVERMIALVRELATMDGVYSLNEAAGGFVATACAIASELPAPVDPDLLEAREIAASMYERPECTWEDKARQAASVRLGKRDHMLEVLAVLTAIKRGRQLATEDITTAGRKVADTFHGFDLATQGDR